jgi:vacuolar protein sorting-associated protein 8
MAEPEDPPPGADSPMEGRQDVDNHADSDVPELDARRDHDSDVPEVSAKADAAAPLSMPLRSRQELVEEGSELGSVDASSVDALPRRVDSPIDSMLSGPDDSPSIQVCIGPRNPSLQRRTKRAETAV